MQTTFFFIFNQLDDFIFVIIGVKSNGKVTCHHQHQNNDAKNAVKRVFNEFIHDFISLKARFYFTPDMLKVEALKWLQKLERIAI